MHTLNAEDCWRRVIKYWQLIDENRSVHRTPHGVTAACVSWGFKIQISKFHTTPLELTIEPSLVMFLVRCAEEWLPGYHHKLRLRLWESPPWFLVSLGNSLVGTLFFLFFSFAFLLITEYYNKFWSTGAGCYSPSSPNRKWLSQSKV